MNKSSFYKKIKYSLPRSILIWRLDEHASGRVLLTFDDGPHPEITQEVLKRLKAYEARAIFFVVGERIKRAPHILERIQEEGHIIGNHSYSHSNIREPWFLSYYRDLRQCQELIEKRTGERPRLFRPPGGRISINSLLVPRLLSLKTVVWSAGGKDWDMGGSEVHLYSLNLLRTLASGDIILLHDSNPYVPIILDSILPNMKSQGLDLSSGIRCLSEGVY